MPTVRKILLTSLFSSLCAMASAQQVAYRLGFDLLFDNLENSECFIPTHTDFDVKIAPEIGMRFSEFHRIMVGTSLRQNLGSGQFPTKADFTAYYQFQNNGFNIAAGLLPSMMMSDYPKSFFETNYDFYNANIGGLLMNYKSDKGFVEILSDWYLLDNENRKDGFSLAATGEHGFFERHLLVGGSVLLNHFKDTAFLEDCSLLERLQYEVYVGSDFKSLTPALDRFSLKVGLLGSAENKRGQDVNKGWINGVGLNVDFDLSYKGFNFTNSCYWGAPQALYYGQYGEAVYSGSAFYNSNFYNRAQVGYTYEWNVLKVSGALVFHCTNKQVALQQLLRLSVNFDDIF